MSASERNRKYKKEKSLKLRGDNLKNKIKTRNL